MFYDYYAFNPPNKSTKDKFASSTTVYRRKHFRWYKIRQRALRYIHLSHIYDAKEIPHQAVMELFDIHHNRTAQKCFEEFYPLYPKTSSFLVPKYDVSDQSQEFLGDPLTPKLNKLHKRLLTKILIDCEFELDVFNHINKMNESPMIEEAPQPELHKDRLTENLLLFLTNVRLSDVLKLKKPTYEVWTEEYEKYIERFSKEVEIEELFVPEMFDISNSSDEDSSSDS